MIRLTAVPPSVRAVLIEVDRRLSVLETGNIDLRGRKITRAGRGTRSSDYVTRGQLAEQEGRGGVTLDASWRRVGQLVHLIQSGDQVGIGISSPINATVKLHVRGGAVAAFPSIGAADFTVFEGTTNNNFAFVCGATGSVNIKFYGSGDSSPDGSIQYNRNARQLTFEVAATNRVRITAAGSLLTQLAGALATTAVDGFLYIPTCAGTPTGTPTAQTGMVALVYDSTNHILYVYSGGAWRTH